MNGQPLSLFTISSEVANIIQYAFAIIEHKALCGGEVGILARDGISNLRLDNLPSHPSVRCS